MWEFGIFEILRRVEALIKAKQNIVAADRLCPHFLIPGVIWYHLQTTGEAPLFRHRSEEWWVLYKRGELPETLR